MKKCLLLTAVVILGTFTAAIAQVPSYVPTDGLVGWWPFNGNANDESGNGNDGTVNEATLTSDRSGVENAAYSFDGVDDFIEIAHNESLNCGSVSISIWFNTNNFISSSGLGPHLLSKREASGWGNSFQMNIGVNQSQNACWADWTVSGNGGIYYNNSSTLMTESWTNLVYTHDETDVKLFLNGVLVQTITSPGFLTFNTLPLWFGARPSAGNYSQWFNGELDDIGIWNRALTEDEIQSLYIGCNVALTTIAGNLSPATLTSTSYACNNNPGSTYQWTVTNGVITAGQGTSNVTVLWGEEGIGTLSVVETNAEGCSGATSTIDVTVVCATTATAIDGPLGPNALTSTTYTCNGVAGSSYQWTISNGVITSGQGTNSVNVLWAGTGLGTISVQETTNANCEGDVLSLDVVVIPTSVEEEQDLSIAIFPNPASNEVTLTASEGLRGKIYTIFSSTGQAVMTGALSIRTVIDLQGLASGTYTVFVDGAVRKTLSVVHE